MAYAALISLEQVLEQILDIDQDSNILAYKLKFRSLQQNVISLVAFLDDYPQDAGALLESRIRDAANQAQDIIEYQISDEMRSDYACWGVMYCFRQVIQSVFPVHLVGEGGTGIELRNWQKSLLELRGVMEQLETIVEEVSHIKSSHGAKEAILSHLHASTSASASSSFGFSPGDKGTMVGLEEDLMEIKDRLSGGSENLRIIPITGMGGIGKTTLARYAYDDPLSLFHFDVRAWVTISQNYSMKKILSGIIHTMNLSTERWIDNPSEQKLLEHLYKSLKGRRYLIVLDDMWDVNAWDVVRRAFPDDYNGSRIIITTRHLHVASDINRSNNPHRMNLMDIDKSWNLLKEKVFAQGHCPSELEQLGRSIAEKCGGLPLAIVVIAGILSKANQMRETWERVARNVNEAIKTGDENFMELLSLSYKHLPHHLRPCFLYMGGFPEDYEITVSKLLKLWVAEGFLKPDGSKHVEELVEEYLEDLIKRSLVLVSKKKSNGKTKAIKIHDMLRDLCLRKAQDEKFLQVISGSSLSLPDGVLNSHRLIVCAHVLVNFPDIDSSPIRTILLPLLDWGFNNWRCFKLLKILDAFTQEFTSFPAELCELFHLRYLAISFQANDKFRIPQSLSKLRYLQTLIVMPSIFKVRIKDSFYLVPFRIWILPQLRHLTLFTFDLFDPWVGTFAALENLHTLARVASFTCSVKVLKMVPNLKKLNIFYGPSDLYKTGWSKYQLNNLAHLHYLEKLSLHVGEPWQFIFQFPDFRLPALQRSDITFPGTLKKLTLISCQFPWSDMTIIGLLPNLEVLKLKRQVYCGEDWETSEGEFCRLKLLLIEESDLHHWVTESSHFPCLQQLHLYHCQRLSEIPSCIGDIPTLKLILLDYCSESMEESAICIEDEQRDYGNDELQVYIQRSARSRRATGRRWTTKEE